MEKLIKAMERELNVNLGYKDEKDPEVKDGMYNSLIEIKNFIRCIGCELTYHPAEGGHDDYYTIEYKG